MDKKTINNILDFDFRISDILPSDYAQNNRVMSSEVSKFTGKYDYNITPYQREIVDCLSPYSPINVISVMKGVQIGISAGVIENGIAYRKSEAPTNMMLVSGNAGLAKKMMQRIDQAIDSCGLRSKLGSTLQRKSKSSGDTAEEKLFAGGSLITYSGQGINNMRQNSVEIIYADDIDMFTGITESAGSFGRAMEGRATSYGASRKIFYISTPELEQTSLIKPLYLKGDQRKYLVPCPCCGEFIEFEWYGKTADGHDYGVMFELKKNRVIVDSVHYRCPKCLNDFKEKKYKQDILVAGHWNPTAEPLAETYRSYHISALYAPIGFKNWTDYAIQYQEAYPRGGYPKQGELQAFNNTVLGLTWEQKGTIPKATKLQNNTRPYKIGEIPYEICKDDENGEILFITCSCDLNGEMEEADGDDVRLDYEIVAWSSKGASYSIDAGSIGTFKNRSMRPKGYDENRQRWTYNIYKDNCVWEEFANVIQRQYSGMNILITAVDVGNWSMHANEFIKHTLAQGISIIAVKGGKEGNFRMTEENKQLYSKSKNKENLYLVNGNGIKDELAEYIKLEPTQDVQPDHFMNFPTPENGKYTYKEYFGDYEGEQRKIKKNSSNIEYFLWERRTGKRNHFFDCRIYNLMLRRLVQDWICKKAGIESTWYNSSVTCEHVGQDNIITLVYYKVMGHKI